MTISDAPMPSDSSPLSRSVQMGTVSGGSVTNPLWTSQIDAEHFAQALRDSLENAGMLAVAQESENYKIDADLISVDQPLIGFSFTVSMQVRYLLTDFSKKTIIFNQIIDSTGTATMSDSFFGVKRLRLANEAAARNNIKKLIEALDAIELRQANK